jgi:hypothetical protein
MKIKLLGFDLAKNVFQLCALNQANKLARISWLIVTTGEPFDMRQAFKPAT